MRRTGYERLIWYRACLPAENRYLIYFIIAGTPKASIKKKKKQTNGEVGASSPLKSSFLEFKFSNKKKMLLLG